MLWNSIYLFLKEFLLHACQCSFVVSIGIIHGFFYLQNNSFLITAYNQSYIILIFHKASNNKWIYITFLSHNTNVFQSKSLISFTILNIDLHCENSTFKYLINITLLAWKYVMSLSFFVAIPGTSTSDITLHGLWTIFYKCTIR